MNGWDAFGACLAITSSVLSNLGVNIQKYSHERNAARVVAEQQANYLCRPIWWIGLVCVIVGSLGDFMAFGFATQALVASLGGASTLIANILIAKYFNKEPLYHTDLLGVVWIVIGVIIIAVITDADRTFTLDELKKKFVRTGFVVYLSVVIISMLSLLGTIKGSYANKLRSQLQFSRRRQKQLMQQFEFRFQLLEKRIQSLEDTISSSINDDRTSQRSQLVNDPDVQQKLKRKVEHVADIMEGLASRDMVPYYYAICSGVVGAISVLLAKCAALLLMSTLHGRNQFEDPSSFAIVAGMISCILVQTHFLNMATMLGDTMTVFPIFQAFWISFSVIGGIVFYETEKDFTPLKWFFYPTALLCIAAGVAFLVQHENQIRLEAIRSDAPMRGRKLSYEEDVEIRCVTGALLMNAPLLNTSNSSSSSSSNSNSSSSGGEEEEEVI